ncbi:MAG TPA: hypothetical protein VK668_04730 [Mucilaginibacter sp.]|nr:hypothetical protein [Mucilaginibacter sp.]
MKRIIFLIAGLVFSISCMSQQPNLSSVVSIKLPDKAEKLNRTQSSSYLKENFKKSKVPLDKENIYIKDGVIISFWDLSVSGDNKRSLQNSKAELLEVLKIDKNLKVNEANIITINHNQFLVINYQEGDEVYLRFYSDYKNNKNISGLIQFKKPDEDKAKGLLDTLLKTIQFKN